MKRQMVFGFTAALIVGAIMVMGACNRHSFEDTEFDTGTQAAFKPHGGGEHEEHGDDHGAEEAHGEAKGHDSDKEAKDGEKHDKGHDAKKEHKEAQKQPAKTQFPKK